jgi:hypothetical protein
MPEQSGEMAELKAEILEWIGQTRKLAARLRVSRPRLAETMAATADKVEDHLGEWPEAPDVTEDP